MLKILAAIATGTFVAAALALFTGMTPTNSAAAETGYGKADSLEARFSAACSESAWPYYAPGCIHSASGDIVTRPIRVVSTDRVNSELRLAGVH